MDILAEEIANLLKVDIIIDESRADEIRKYWGEFNDEIDKVEELKKKHTPILKRLKQNGRV